MKIHVDKKQNTMRKFNKIITIQIEADQIASTLLSKIDDKFAHAENVVESIIGTMNEHGLSMLFNALNGYSPEVDFEVGQEVELRNFETYGYWTKDSIEQGNTVRGTVKTGVIKDIDLYSTEKLEIEFSIPTKEGFRTERKWMSHVKCSQLVKVEDVKRIDIAE